MSDENSESQPAPEAEPATETQATTEGQKDLEFDPYSVDVDELRQKIERETYAAEPESPEEVQTVDEPVEAVAEEQQAGEPSEEDAEPPAEQPEIDETQARLELAEASAKHFETMLGRRGGEEGFFRQKAAKLEEEMSQLRAAISSGREDDYVPRDTPAAAAPPPAQPRADANQAYLAQLALKDAVSTFMQSNPDLQTKENGSVVTDPDFAQAISGSLERLRDVMQTGDPTFVQEETTRMLESAASKSNLVKKQKQLEEVRRRKADQAKTFTDKKRASAASSGSTPARENKKALDPMNMDLDELKKRIEEERFT